MRTRPPGCTLKAMFQLNSRIPLRSNSSETAVIGHCRDGEGRKKGPPPTKCHLLTHKQSVKKASWMDRKPPHHTVQEHGAKLASHQDSTAGAPVLDTRGSRNHAPLEYTCGEGVTPSSRQSGPWSHRIFQRYATTLPTSLSCIASTDQRRLAVETCCGVSVRY